MAGFEPASEGVKVPCLTAWLHPCVTVPRRNWRPRERLQYKATSKPTTPKNRRSKSRVLIPYRTLNGLPFSTSFIRLSRGGRPHALFCVCGSNTLADRPVVTSSTYEDAARHGVCSVMLTIFARASQSVAWSEWGGSNSRPPEPRLGALPTALHPDKTAFHFDRSGVTCRAITFTPKGPIQFTRSMG